MSCIGVECWTDFYFFAKLLQNKNSIRKEKDKNAVVKGVKKSIDRLAIGIIDDDDDANLPSKILQEFDLIDSTHFTKVFKHEQQFQFVFVLSPTAIEKWFVEYLKINQKELPEFGFNDFEAFTSESKKSRNGFTPTFTACMKHILDTYEKSENHIYKIMRQINYLLNKKFNFDIIEFNNV